MLRLKSLQIEEVATVSEFNLQIVHVQNSKIHLLGVVPSGASINVTIQDFKPTLLVRTKSQDPETVLIDLQECLPAEHVHSLKIGWRYRAVGAAPIIDKNKMNDPSKVFERKRYPVIEIEASNIWGYNTIEKQLKEMKHFKIFNNHDLVIQFLSQSGFEYQTNVKLNRSVMTIESKSPNIVCATAMDNLTKYNSPDLPKVLKCFMNVLAVSRDGSVDLTHSEYQPVPHLPCDRVLTVCFTFIWSHQSEPIFQETTPLTFTEAQIFDRIEELFDLYDPDLIFHFPDVFDSIEYLARRSYYLQRKLKWERNGKFMNVSKYEDRFFYSLKTRTLFDLRETIVKKATVCPEAYDLRTLSCNSDLRSPPEIYNENEPVFSDINTFVRSTLRRPQIIQFAKRFNDRMVALERQCDLFVEFANISRTCDSSIYDAVSGGQQQRVFGRLTHKYEDTHFYMNKSDLAKGALRFSINERPPTFPDPEEAPETLKLRSKCLLKFQENCIRMKHKIKTKKKKTASLQLNEDSSSEEEISDEDVKEGGNVMKSCPDFYTSNIAITDFASLYPSIMIAFHISYENIVTKPKYLDLNGVPYIFVAINSSQTVAIVDDGGVMCEMLQEFLNARKVAKKKLSEAAPGSFAKINFNKQQESLKVICNATYGFCGAEKGLFAMREVMFIVTSLGRFMQKIVALYIGAPKGQLLCADVHFGEKIIREAPGYLLPSVYGDTDSIFALLLTNVTKQHFVQWVHAMGIRFGMNDNFTWDYVQSYWVEYLKSKNLPLVDIVNCEIDTWIRCVAFLIFDKLAKECTGLFRPAVSLEFENNIDQFWIAIWKKTYFARKWSPMNPFQPETKGKELALKTTGMAAKKRDWCLFVRKCCKKIMLYFANGESHLAREFVIQSMEKLANDEVPIDELQVSKVFKGFSYYKNLNTTSCQVALKMFDRTRCEPEPKSRISYVIVRGTENICCRAETPSLVRKLNLEVDLKFYMESQFYNPVKKLFLLLPHLIDFDFEFNRVFRKVCNSQNGIIPLGEMRTKHELMTLSDLKKTKPRKKQCVVKPSTLKFS